MTNMSYTNTFTNRVLNSTASSIGNNTPVSSKSQQFMQYKQQSVNTMSGGELLILLYDEILKNLKLASQLYDNKDYINAEKCTEKAKKVFSHLSSTLDFNIDISNQLYSLYDFFIKQIVSAEVKRDKSPLAEVINLVAELKDTYAQASKIAHINK